MKYIKVTREENAQLMQQFFKQSQLHLLRCKTRTSPSFFGNLGLDCIDNKLWTDEKKIKAFSNLLDTYCDKCVKLVEDNKRRHLERLKLQRQQKQKEYEAEQAKYNKEIAELENKLRQSKQATLVEFKHIIKIPFK